MKTGFEDPIEPKEGKKLKHDPWSFECPPYDERSSCFVNAGSNYGVGHRQPVGREGNPKEKAGTMPEHKAKGMKDDHVYKGKPSLIHNPERE